MRRLTTALIRRRTTILLAVTMILGFMQFNLQARSDNLMNLKFEEGRLTTAISMAKRQGMDTSKYSTALRNIKLDTNAKRHAEEVVAKLQSMSQELIKKMDEKERPIQAPNSHVGLVLGFQGSMPADKAASSAYLSSKVSAEGPLVVKGMSFDGSAIKSGGFKIGDRILAVDGSNVSGLTIKQVLDKLMGPANTTVSIQYQSGDHSPAKTVKLLRTSKTPLQPM